MLFVALGGLLVWRFHWLAWLHVPAFLWGAAVELSALDCPLTRLENQLLQASGDAGYGEGFIAHYLLPVLYPAGLTPDSGVVLGIAVLAGNGLLYAILAWRRFLAPHRHNCPSNASQAGGRARTSPAGDSTVNRK